MGKLFGYARVSSVDQDLTVQREALRKVGVQAIFEEKISGTKRDNREELGKVLHILGEGDTLVVTRLDRLGRSMRDLANIAHEIQEAGANLKVLEQHVDLDFGRSRLLRRARSVRSLRDRCASRAPGGGDSQGQAGRQVSRRDEAHDRARVRALKSNGAGPSAIAHEMGISRRQVSRILEEEPA
jgi:DNA invertase Pin-like site-specific DNA recombinase